MMALTLLDCNAATAPSRLSKCCVSSPTRLAYASPVEPSRTATDLPARSATLLIWPVSDRVVMTLVTDEVTKASTARPQTSHMPCQIRPSHPNRFLRDAGLPEVTTDMTV